MFVKAGTDYRSVSGVSQVCQSDVSYLWQQCGVVLQQQQEQVVLIELVQRTLSQ